MALFCQNSTRISCRKGRSTQATAREHPDPTEGATCPSRSCTWPPAAPSESLTASLPLLPERPCDQHQILIISDDIRCNDVTHCARIWRFDIMRPASLCRLTAAALAHTWPKRFTKKDGELFNNLADSGAPMNSRNRGLWSCSPYVASASTSAVPVYDVMRYGQPGIPVMINGLSSVSMGVAPVSKGPSLMMSSAVDNGILSGETPEANTVGTADWSEPMLPSCGMLYIGKVIGVSIPGVLWHWANAIVLT